MGLAAMSVTDQIVAVLRQHPHGLTTAQLAHHLGRPPKSFGAQLSKSVYPGYVEREYGTGRRTRFAIWKVPAEAAE